ncbi:MAG: HipA family kinase [Arcticibacter sp.]
MKKVVPIRFDGYMQSGGSTKPWRIVAIPADVDVPDEVPYVAKVFSDKNIQQGNSIGKEFICNFLSGEFDLAVPEACIINLYDPDFYSTLGVAERDVLAGKFKGVTYCSELSNGILVNEQLKGSFNIHDCATLFAFDCLVLNVDRGGFRDKPNLLADDDGFILIDHELTLNIIDDEDGKAFTKLIENFHQNNWPGNYKKHLFFNLLKSYKGTKKTLFDTFEEGLKVLNIDKVKWHLEELQKEGIAIGASDILISYLRHLKQNSNKFRNILLGLIS